MHWILPTDFVPVIAIVSVFTFLIISTVVHYIYKAFCFSRLTQLKERLLEAGMSSAEIERIVNAGSGCADKLPPIQQKKPA